MLQDKRWLLLDCKNKTPAQWRPGGRQLRAAMRSSLAKPHVRLIRYEPGRPEVRGDFAERRKPHFDRAVKLTDASGCHNRLCTDRYHIPPQYGIGLSGSAGGIEPAEFHKAVALLRATLPVISVLSVAVLPTISIPELTTALPHWLSR